MRSSTPERRVAIEAQTDRSGARSLWWPSARLFRVSAELLDQGWGGERGEVWVQNQTRQDAMLAGFTPRLLAAAAVGPGDQVLDIGCGCGETSLQVARVTSPGRVLGMDLSAPMLDRARQRAQVEGVSNVTFEQADAQIHPFAGATFDVATSRFGVMFFDDARAAFANIRRALRSGGKLVFTCWQSFERNEHAALPLHVVASQVSIPLPSGDAGPDPYTLADPERVRDLLAVVGFEQIRFEAVEERLRVGDDADDVLRFYRTQPLAKTFMADAPAEMVERTLGAIRAALQPHETPEGVFLASGWSAQPRPTPGSPSPSEHQRGHCVSSWAGD